MRDLRQRFLKFIAEENLFSVRDKLLLAISGGVDSVVLAALCEQCGFSYTLVHCNFRLRGLESDRDEDFVATIAAKFNRPLLVKDFDTERYAAENKCSIQVAARELRYQWFTELLTTPALENGKLLTAHHADDAIETLMMNFFKGTGITGLRSILPRQNVIVRPLLFARKAAILDFASEHELKFVEDSSNLSDKYTRNYFRHQVLPLVNEVFPQALDNLSDNLKRFRDIETLYIQALAVHIKKLLVLHQDEVHIPVLKLQKTVPLLTVLYEILKPYGFSPQQTGDVLLLLSAESGKYVSSASYRVIRNRKWLIISPIQERSTQTIVIDEPAGSVLFGDHALTWKTFSADLSKLPQDPGMGCFDASKIHYPLVLRPLRTGDYFYPLGMPKKKKVARFLSAQKLSVTEKEKTWVIEMNHKIIWVVGRRIDDRFKITDSTKTMLKFVQE